MNFKEYGFRYPQDLIMTFIGGSQLHGAKISGTDDTDYFGVFVEPPSVKLGVDLDEHFVTTTGDGRGNGPKDIDICLYSLNKWARLVCKGNPSSLHFLFAKPEFQTMSWVKLVLYCKPFLAKTHIKSYLGFANDQYKRLIGEKGQKNVHRAELEELHGYDTKYAMHIVRLYQEAQELMDTGYVTLPRPNADELIAIRLGKYKLSEFCALIKGLEAKALASFDSSQLPERVDRKEISKMVATAYREHWAFRDKDIEFENYVDSLYTEEEKARIEK